MTKTLSRILLEVVQDDKGQIIASREKLICIDLNKNHLKTDSKEIIKNGKGVVIAEVDAGNRSFKLSKSKQSVAVDLITGRVL